MTNNQNHHKSKQIYSLKNVTLKRVLGLKDAITINLGAIIGAGIFVIIGLAAGISGSFLPISIVVSSLIALFTGLSFSIISKHVSSEGGVYEYVSAVTNRYLGFLGGILWVFSNIIAIAAVSLSLITYINTLFGINANVVEISSQVYLYSCFIQYFRITSLFNIRFIAF